MSRARAITDWLAEARDRASLLAAGGARRLSSRPRAVAGGGVLVLVGYFCFTGWWGIDFGGHWDEWYHRAGVGKCIQKMQWVPQDFIYNGMYFLLALPLLIAHLGHKIPSIIGELNARTPTLSLDVTSLTSVQELQGEANALLASKRYTLEARTLFLFVAALAIIWVYLTILRLYPRRYLAALAGAAFLALSWEFQYHARIIAIDAPLAQFLALQLLLLCCAWQALDGGRFAGWLAAAAAAGGIVFGCKTTGVFAMTPVLLLPWLRRDEWPRHQRMALAGLAALAFFAAAFAVSPAMFLDPLHYFETMRYVAWDYNQQAGPSRPYYVAGVGDHLARVMCWFAVAVPAPSPGRALLGTAVAAIGLTMAFRRHPRLIGSWIALCAITIAFLSTNRLLIVRQYVMFIPFMAVMFGAGVTGLRFRVRGAGARSLLTAVLVAGFVLNGRWLFAASQSVRTTTPETIKAELLRDLAKERRPVCLSKSVHDLIAADIERTHICHPTKPEDQSARSVIMHFADCSDLKANRAFAAERVYSSYEVNYDWYSTWPGHHQNDRILRYPIQALAGLKIGLTETFDCVPR